MTDTSKSSGWVMPDPDRCQCEWLGGSFMTLGPRQMERCTKVPTVIVSEPPTGLKGEPRGSMSLCEEHFDVALQKMRNLDVWRKE